MKKNQTNQKQMEKQIPYKILNSLLLTNFVLSIIISLGWLTYFIFKTKDALNQLRGLKKRPKDPENNIRTSRIRNDYYKSIIFIYYLVIEGALLSCMLVECIYEVVSTHSPVTTDYNCTIARESYLQARHDYTFAIILSTRRGLAVYLTLVFVLILYYFYKIYKLKERFRYSMREAKWLLVTMIPAFFVTVTTLTPWTILIDWITNGIILEIVYFIGVYYAKKVNAYLVMRQQDLIHAYEIDRFTVKQHSSQIRQYKMFLKPIFILGQYLILSKVLDECVKECVGTVILNQCWVEKTFKIPFKFEATAYIKKVYYILKLAVSANIALALLLFTGTLIILNLILIWNNLKWRRNQYQYTTSYKASTPLLANHNFPHEY